MAFSKDEKLKEVKKLQTEIYDNYIKGVCIYRHLSEKYKSELSEDIEAVREELGKARTDAKSAQELGVEVNEYAFKIAELEGRIDLCNQKNDEFNKVQERINEAVSMLKYLEDMETDLLNDELELEYVK